MLFLMGKCPGGERTEPSANKLLCEQIVANVTLAESQLEERQQHFNRMTRNVTF